MCEVGTTIIMKFMVSIKERDVEPHTTLYTVETGMDWTHICRMDGPRTPRKTLDQAKYMVVVEQYESKEQEDRRPDRRRH